MQVSAITMITVDASRGGGASSPTTVLTLVAEEKEKRVRKKTLKARAVLVRLASKIQLVPLSDKNRSCIKTQLTVRS